MWIFRDKLPKVQLIVRHPRRENRGITPIGGPLLFWPIRDLRREMNAALNGIPQNDPHDVTAYAEPGVAAVGNEAGTGFKRPFTAISGVAPLHLGFSPMHCARVAEDALDGIVHDEPANTPRHHTF
jgi:hypothetical protein